MKNKIAGILLTIIITICSLNTPVYARETPDELKNLYAQSAVLMDADSGRILFGKEEQKVLPMASTTKIMTCILALEHMKEKQTVQASKEAVKQPKVHLGVKEGERFYLKDILYSLMLESHNDSAVMIAEGIAGTVEKFAQMMNKKAEEIGCTDTYFITPNGLDAEDDYGIHSTTAKDLALIMRYCINESAKSNSFLEISRTKNYAFTNIEGSRSFSCANHNAFLDMMDGVIAGKTGYTNNAGYCYVTALKQGERIFIVTLLACGWPNNKTYKWKDTKKLMKYGLDNYNYRNLYVKQYIQEIPVINGASKDSVKIDTLENKEVYALARSDEKALIKINIPDSIHAPVKKNQSIGKLIYYMDDKILKIYNIVSLDEVKERNFEWCLSEIIGFYLL